MRVPGLGEVLRNWQVAQFSRALAVLLESGVPTAQAITLGGGVVGTILAEAASEQACAAFFEERSLFSGLMEAGFFTTSYLSLVKCAEETGSVAQVVSWLADESEMELPRSTRRLLANCRKVGLGLQELPDAPKSRHATQEASQGDQEDKATQILKKTQVATSSRCSRRDRRGDRGGSARVGPDAFYAAQPDRNLR
jgi:hypothetical protein